MNNKHTVLLSILLMISLSLSAQVFLQSPALSSEKQPDKIASNKKSLFFKTGLTNLIHPYAPSLDLGLELSVKRTSVEVMYGLQTPYVFENDASNRLPLDSYHKVFASLRYHDTDRIYTAAQVPLVYFAGEVYYSWGKDRRQNDYAIDRDFNRIEYASADIQRETLGLTLKGGVIFPFSNRLELEFVAGGGLLQVERFYTFFGAQAPIPNFNFQDGFVTFYNDRALGKFILPNVVLNAKFNVRIF